MTCVIALLAIIAIELFMLLYNVSAMRVEVKSNEHETLTAPEITDAVEQALHNHFAAD